MSIMFRCPCGRTMVAESDRAGAIVTCPNCRRALKVPTGKDRGVELAAAPAGAKTRTSRRCQRCGKDIPVDSQICPHCKAIQVEAAAPAAQPQAPVAAPKAAARPASTVVLGGYHGSWWTRLPTAGKTGVLVGVFVFVILLVIILIVSYSSWSAGQLQEARDKAQKYLAEGRSLEDQGKFEKAYVLYSFTSIKETLRASELAKDRELADTLDARYVALQYLVPSPQTRESVQWKPGSQEELDQAMAELRQLYPGYRQLALAIGAAGLEAIQVGQTNPSQAAFDEKVAKTIDAYVNLITKTTVQQRAQITFQQITAAIKELGYANRHWNDADGGKQRNQYLLNAKSRLEGMQEIASRPDYPDGIW